MTDPCDADVLCPTEQALLCPRDLLTQSLRSQLGAGLHIVLSPGEELVRRQVFGSDAVLAGLHDVGAHVADVIQVTEFLQRTEGVQPKLRVLHRLDQMAFAVLVVHDGQCVVGDDGGVRRAEAFRHPAGEIHPHLTAQQRVFGFALGSVEELFDEIHIGITMVFHCRSVERVVQLRPGGSPPRLALDDAGKLCLDDAVRQRALLRCFTRRVGESCLQHSTRRAFQPAVGGACAQQRVLTGHNRPPRHRRAPSVRRICPREHR